MLYESRAIPEHEWTMLSATFIAHGFEPIKTEGGVVYIRKLLPGVEYKPPFVIQGHKP